MSVDIVYELLFILLGLEYESKKVVNAFIENRLVERAVFYRLDDEFVVDAAACRHFEVETCVHAVRANVYGAPVAHD